ncbi:MAG TPA: chromate efflux transporter [Candidatus Nitrosotalea sp.]|nr:chromate efflux transporter [Candidatus Nitrosotalea sp.]
MEPERSRDRVDVGPRPSLNWSSLGEVSFAFLRLGLISFGGPVAHLGYLREEFVENRRWLRDEAYGDLVALCQFLPGPASSQVVFALGMLRSGWPGGVVASFCFTLPSAILMILFGYGIGALGDLQSAAWLHGLKLAAVAVVAQAVLGMGRNLCPDLPRQVIGISAAALVLLFPGALIQIGVIGGGAVIGWWFYHRTMPLSGKPGFPDWRNHIGAASALGAFFSLLVLLPAIASTTGNRNAAIFDSFYRAGSLVFGGGHVVLPLLRAEVVPKGWVTDDAFLAGYGAVQAVPGPLFTFAAYLGTVMQPGPGAWLEGCWCLLAIFLPAWLLIAGAFPFWEQLRRTAWMQSALGGANATVVGVLLAALYRPVCTEAVKGPRDAAAALMAFGLLQWCKVPPWIVVPLLAVAGRWLVP